MDTNRRRVGAAFVRDLVATPNPLALLPRTGLTLSIQRQ
jgi:hypothetical protein